MLLPLLRIPCESVTREVLMIPVVHAIGVDFKPAPLVSMVHGDL